MSVVLGTIAHECNALSVVVPLGLGSIFSLTPPTTMKDVARLKLDQPLAASLGASACLTVL